METYYQIPQEVWSKEKCEKAARHIHRDSCGTPLSIRGFVEADSTSYPRYSTQRFNGGTIAPDGKLYNGTQGQLPKIPDEFEFFYITSWGLFIRKKV